MAGGALLLYRGMLKSFVLTVGFSFIAVAGLGTIMVGLFPENTISSLHIIGAALSFAVGNVGLLFLGLATGLPRPLRLCAFLFGVTSLLALMAFLSHQYLGIGVGGMERVVAYPQTIWLIAFAVCMLKIRYSNT